LSSLTEFALARNIKCIKAVTCNYGSERSSLDHNNARSQINSSCWEAGVVLIEQVYIAHQVDDHFTLPHCGHCCLTFILWQLHIALSCTGYWNGDPNFPQWCVTCLSDKDFIPSLIACYFSTSGACKAGCKLLLCSPQQLQTLQLSSPCPMCSWFQRICSSACRDSCY
jgi:hypothetical protein